MRRGSLTAHGAVLTPVQSCPPGTFALHCGMAEKIVLGTRGSELALTQTRMVEDALRASSSELIIETKVISTRGDEPNATAAGPISSPSPAQDLPRSAGRKGLFTGEIERALLRREIDVAVHSAKDLPSELADGTEIAAVLPRAPVDDVLVSAAGYNVQTVPINGLVATGSVRRRHQLRWTRSDLEIIDLKGNVPTRLRKLVKNGWHALILARAGLERLGLQTSGPRFHFEGGELSAQNLPRDVFLPPGGQGVIAMQIRRGDDRVRRLLDSSNHLDTQLCLQAERAFLRLLNADCNQPVGVYAALHERVITIRAQVFDAEAAAPRQKTVRGPREEPERLAGELWRQVHER